MGLLISMVIMVAVGYVCGAAALSYDNPRVVLGIAIAVFSFFVGIMSAYFTKYFPLP